MKLHITIDLDNAAFDDGTGGDIECSRILHDLAMKIDDNSAGVESVNCTKLRDINGNTVGDVWLTSDDDSNARYLSDMARYVNAVDHWSHQVGAEMAIVAGRYLAAIGHPDAPAWAKK